MQVWIEFAKGPLFALTFLIMVFGLLRLLVIQVHSLAQDKARRLRNAPWKKIFSDAGSWVVPIRHMIPGTRVFSSFSFLLHIGLILVPLFLADHIVLWSSWLGLSLPSLPPLVADGLTLLTILCAGVLLGCRLLIERHRMTSRRMDYLLLPVILAPFISGFLASHPGINPFSWESMMLTHLLSAELLFVLMPFTKLAHVVLFFFDRISQVHWQLRPGAGKRVARALFGEEAKV
jgi:nitrate reductase gamma subunit